MGRTVHIVQPHEVAMQIDRRSLILSFPLAAALGYPDRGFATVDRALFWRIVTRDNRSGVVFGYGRVAASLVPDVVTFHALGL
jgi:hypothetical protein